MRVEITIPATDAQDRTFLTWAPVKGSARLADAAGAADPTLVMLRNAGAAGGGRVAFDKQRSDEGTPELELQLPANGTAVDFWVAGEFMEPSSTYGDTAIEAVVAGNPVGRRELMVRIRKNAVKLSGAERDRFLLALGKLNDAGQGPFKGFRDTHVAAAQDEAHGFPAFPPWHRAYLLDLERELQAIDASVALPYWRFDEPAPALFAPEFLGMPPADAAQGDVIVFPHGHALEFWRTDGSDSIERRPRYDIAGAPPQSVGGQPAVISQDATLALGTNYADFRLMEFSPHGRAHTSFLGPIGKISKAAKDPLFFMLHANIDRLWARWQWENQRTDPANAATFSLGGSLAGPRPGLLGHNLGDTMWPWNGEKTPPRPTFDPPRGAFPASATVGRPGPHPTVRDMIDYQGVHGEDTLGFDYDDVPFELHSGVTV